jgi:hypothetical protein
MSGYVRRRAIIHAIASSKAIQEHEVPQQARGAIRKARVAPSLAPGSPDPGAAYPLPDARLHVSATKRE